MTVLIPAIIFSVMITWLKLREEPRLEQRFGQRYRDYQRQTPFLVPRFKPLLRDLASPAVDWLRRQKTEVVNVERADYPSAQLKYRVRSGLSGTNVVQRVMCDHVSHIRVRSDWHGDT